MAKRIAPIPNETTNDIIIETEDRHLKELKYLPKFIDYFLNYLSATKRGKAASLYSYLSTLSDDIGKKVIHIPTNRIMYDLGWSNKTIGVSRKILTDFGLIGPFRLTNNGLKSESRIHIYSLFKINLWSLHQMIFDEKYNCGCKEKVLNYLERECKNYTVEPSYWNHRENNKSPRRCKNYTVKEECNSSFSTIYAASLNELAATKEEKKNSSGVEDSFSFLLRDGTYFYPSIQKIESLRRRFSQLNVELEFKRIQEWCDDNPENRKTRRGANSFITNWMTNAVKYQRKTKPKPNKKYQSIDFYYDKNTHKQWATELADKIIVKPHEVKPLTKRIKKIKHYHDSIPQHIRNSSPFQTGYGSYWMMIHKYVDWLKNKVRFDEVDGKLIDIDNKMFGKFIRTQSKSDTTYDLSFRDGEYIDHAKIAKQRRQRQKNKSKTHRRA